MLILKAASAAIAVHDVPGLPLDFHRVGSALSTVRASHAPGTEENIAAWVEMLPFNLSTEAEALEPLQAYFGPFGSYTDPTGQVVYSPDPRDVPPAEVEIWEHRRDTCKHPALVARYADVMWEVGFRLIGKRRNIEDARRAIDAYIAAADGLLYEQPHDRATAALRASSLAASIRDQERQAVAKSALLAVHNSASQEDGLRYSDVVEKLLWDRSISLTDEERGAIIDGLEHRLAIAVDESSAHSFSPFQAEVYGDQLARHYRRFGSREDYDRVWRRVGAAFEAAASVDPGMAASAHLDSAIRALTRAGDDGAVERLRIAKAAAVDKSIELMTLHEHRFEITRDQMEQVLASIVSDNLELSLARLAARYVDRLQDLEGSLRRGARDAPLQALISIQIMEGEHVAAVIGGLDEDFEGRLMHEASQRFQFNELWLDRALDRLMETHKLDANVLVSWADRLGAFPDSGLLREGIKAWLREDWSAALHILIPQIEAGLRNVLKGLGGAAVKAHQQGGGREVLLNLAEVLASDKMKQALGADLNHYFRAAYADARGLNLRNKVSHGLAPLEYARSGICNLLLHSVLVLGCWRDIATSRQLSSASVT